MIGRWGRKGVGRGFLPSAAALLVLALALAAAPAAQARVTLVATGTPELAFLGIPANEVVARLALPGPARAVAVSRDGARGYVSAGSEIVALDVNTRLETGRSAIGAGQPEIADIELAARGARLYAVRGTELVVLDPQTLGQLAVIDLRGEGMQIAVANSGSSAAVTLRSGRVAVVALGSNVLLRHVKLKGATGVAIADSGLTYVTARKRLRVIAPQQRRPRKKAIKLPEGAGGGLTLSPGRSRLVVGAAPGGRSGAIVELRNGRVQRIVAGPGPGRAAWYPDASRIVVADGGAATVSLVSPFSRGRIGLVTLPGTAPSDLVVQPGLALMSGTDAADRLTGTRGDDRMLGLAGDDFLRGGRGRDVLEGGLGNDTLSGANNSDVIGGDEGDDLMTGGTGDDVLRGALGADNVNGGTGNDTLQGDDGDDALDGGDGDDTIEGGTGNDTIVEKGFGDDKLLDGGPGNDIIRGGRGSEQMILGGEGVDELYGETGSERILGGAGNDLIDGGRAGDRLEGDEGEDVIKGDAGNDHLYGRDGNDELVGGNGIDVFDGGPGDDVIRAADDSPDTGTCGDGNDTLYVEADAPTRDAFTGCETVVAVAAEPDSDTTAVITIRGTRNPDRLVGTPGDDSIFGRGGADRIYGMAGNDYVDGDANNDRLHGGAGDDLIAGRKGNDTIWGDAGNDRITGDRGPDRIFGGAGNDTIFGNLDPDEVDGGSGNDRINVVHGGSDVVVCGRGKDVVFADPRDKVSGDCESVRR